MHRRDLSIVLALLATSAIDATAPAAGGEGEAVRGRPALLLAVGGHERRDDGDVIHLRNGDRLTGTVLDEDFAIRTPYGDIQLPLHRCAGVVLGAADADDDAIIAVNRNRLSGRVLDRSVRFRLEVSGDAIDVRCDKIAQLVLRRADHELRGLLQDPGIALLELVNGDLLTGRLAQSRVDLTTEYATMDLRLAEVADLVLDTPGKPAATVTMTNGDVLRGRLNVAAFAIELDLGPKVERIPLRLVMRAHLGALPESWYEGGDGGGGAGAEIDAEFFGVRATGARIAFVVDRSGSMSRGQRMTLVRQELARSLAAMPDGTPMSVLLFGGDTARPPVPPGWLVVSRDGIDQVVDWLGGVEPGGGSVPLPALADTLALQPTPDVVFFLTDGAIPADTGALLAPARTGREHVVIHVIALGSRAGQDDLARLAAEWGGAYHFVTVP